MSQAVQKIKLNDFLAGREVRFETLNRCRFKRNGRWIKAKIDMEKRIVYGLNGEILRRCC